MAYNAATMAHRSPTNYPLISTGEFAYAGNNFPLTEALFVDSVSPLELAHQRDNTGSKVSAQLPRSAELRDGSDIIWALERAA